MKLHFLSDLPHQQAAWEAVTELFAGQESERGQFSVSRSKRQVDFTESLVGVGNRLGLLEDQLLANLQRVQARNALPQDSELRSMDFTVEMETGTGKTYVYLRTILELHKRFDFTKFVIVVPSVAIKEGVYKTLQITEAHFKALYAGVPVEFFLYDSAKLGQVRNFATSNLIQIMVVTVGAINKKDVAVIYKNMEQLGDETAIDLIAQTRPVVIVDEPQSVDGGLEGKGKEALALMDPLCTLRYSATHVHKHHMVYRLDAVDAYQQQLVKQIEVDGATVERAHNRPYVRLIAVNTKKGEGVTAKVELDVQGKDGVQRKEVTVRDGDDLQQTTGRDLYANHRVGEISAAKDKPYLELRVPGDDVFLRPGEAYADVDLLAVQRELIRRTIRQHLHKVVRLQPRGIKVLSLFFIDEVAKYRSYDKDGNPQKGDYARIFEEEYKRAIRLPDFADLFAKSPLPAEEVHDGYFAIDKKGSRFVELDLDKEGKIKNQSGRDDAERAYNLILKEKEKLLSFETPLQFIFSHSALREGWDNPNVFQICSLRNMRSERERRQTLGRGLRLCVDQSGQRVYGHDVNVLTVVAQESFEEYASQLQREIEQETGLTFGMVKDDTFLGIQLTLPDGSKQPLGKARADALRKHLVEQGYTDKQGKVQDKLRKALKDGDVVLPAEVGSARNDLVRVLTKLAGKLDVKDAGERRKLQPNRVNLDSAEFQALWERIKWRTTYRVAFDNVKLVEQCTEALRDAPAIQPTRLQWNTGELGIERSGVTTEHKASSDVTLKDGPMELPDLLTTLEERTALTRKSLLQIVQNSGRLKDFVLNPQMFIDHAAKTINAKKQLAIVDGIRYQRLGPDDYYRQELFVTESMESYLKNMVASKRGVYDHVVYDSDVERRFAEALDRHEGVKVYAKLPQWFEIPTPLGPYRPDWAVLVDAQDGERLYFVVETKSTAFLEELRQREAAKIQCGQKHVEALADDATLRFASPNRWHEGLPGV